MRTKISEPNVDDELSAHNDSLGQRIPTSKSCEQKKEKKVRTMVQLAREVSLPVQASPVR